jgi:hypothetical protein
MTPKVGLHPGDSSKPPTLHWKCSCGEEWDAPQNEECPHDAGDEDVKHVVAKAGAP